MVMVIGSGFLASVAFRLHVSARMIARIVLTVAGITHNDTMTRGHSMIRHAIRYWLRFKRQTIIFCDLRGTWTHFSLVSANRIITNGNQKFDV